jgi:uncharacterized RDD family membrane protein YckC
MDKASFSQRFVAWLIDQAVLWITYLLLGLAFGLASGIYTSIQTPRTDPEVPLLNVLLSLGISVYMLILTLGNFLYFGYFWSRREQSIGMGVMNIRVVKTDLRSLSFLMAGLRGSLGYYLSGLIFGLGYLWFFVDKRDRTWHDRIFNTVVLKK